MTSPTPASVERWPTAPGAVHGIVQLHPVIVIQCDGCGRVAIGEQEPHRMAVIMQSGIVSPGGRPGRRLCARCRVDDESIQDFATRRLRESPEAVAFYEAQMTPRDVALADPRVHLGRTDEPTGGAA